MLYRVSIVFDIFLLFMYVPSFCTLFIISNDKNLFQFSYSVIFYTSSRYNQLILIALCQIHRSIQLITNHPHVRPLYTANLISLWISLVGFLFFSLCYWSNSAIYNLSIIIYIYLYTNYNKTNFCSAKRIEIILIKIVIIAPIPNLTNLSSFVVW